MSRKLIKMLPFMDEEEIKTLSIKIANKEVKGIAIEILFPFLEQSDLDEIVDELIKTNDSKKIKKALPFVSDNMLNKIHQAIIDGTITKLKEHYLYPFLTVDQMKHMFNKAVEESMDEPGEE